MDRILRFLYLLVSATALLSVAAAAAQTQDWTGVPNPSSSPQLQTLYAQALQQAQQSVTLQAYVPATPGVPAQYSNWVTQATVLFDAKWNYWQKLNPGAYKANNPQYLKDLSAWNAGCFPQCPNFGGSGNTGSGAKSGSPTAPQNTINPMLYGPGALSQGLVAPSAVAQSESDGEASALISQIQVISPGSPAQSDVPPDDPLPYTAPRELDFNHPETLPADMPGVSVITFPQPSSSGTPQSVPCMTAVTCDTDDEEEDENPASNPAPAQPSLTATAPGAQTPAAQNNAAAPAPADQNNGDNGGSSIADTVNGWLNTVEPYAKAALQTTQQLTKDYANDVLTDDLPDAVINQLDTNNATLRYRTDFGSAFAQLKDIVSGPDETTPNLASFVANMALPSVANKAYDLGTAAAVNAALDANPDQRGEIAFRAYILPNLLAPKQLVSGFKSFWGIVVEGKNAGEE